MERRGATERGKRGTEKDRRAGEGIGFDVMGKETVEYRTGRKDEGKEKPDKGIR